MPGFWARLWSSAPNDEIPTFQVGTNIGPSVTVRGDVRGPGGVRVDGVVTGSVDSDGPVVIGETGTVDGTVRGSHVVVLGRVRGDARSSGHLEIGPRGKVVGDVTVESLRVHKGGVFRGTSRMPGADDLATTTSPFGILPLGGADSDSDAVRGRTLPPVNGAVPPPARHEDAPPSISLVSPIPAPVASEDRFTSATVAKQAPPLPERPRAAANDD